LFSADCCHKKKIARRVLKPENLLLANMNNDTSIKIADFGFGKKFESQTASSYSAAPHHVAPEALDLTTTKCDERADI
jgi:calcium/calmodulin-dependent protein kinase I